MEPIIQEQSFTDYLLNRKHKPRVLDSLAAIKTFKQHQLIPVMNERERVIISKFAGWGAVSRLFLSNNAPQWEILARAELLELLTEDEYSDCRSTMLNAFPTSPLVIQAMWEFLQRVGFAGGRVLDPGCGLANFLTFCPEEVQSTISRYVGVEIEPMTCGMAKRLHPTSSFHSASFLGFLQPFSSADLAIGNVPFEDGVQAGYLDFKPSVALHARIVLRTLDLLKPGGLALLITSTGLMDSNGANQEYVQLRERIDQRAKFLGALRLPDETHKFMSGTECTSDLILLQKRWDENDSAQLVQWRNTVPSDLNEHSTGKPILFNEYWQRFPERLLGVPCNDRTTFGDDFALAWENGEPLINAIREALTDWANELPSLLLGERADQTADQITTTTQETNSMYASNSQPQWNENATVAPNDRGGVEFRFSAKPPDAVIAALKKASFRYRDNNSDPRWYGMQSAETWKFVADLASDIGIDVEIPANFAAPKRESRLHVVANDPAPIAEPTAPTSPEPAPVPTTTPDPQASPPATPPSLSVNMGAWSFIEQIIQDVSGFVDTLSEDTVRLQAEMSTWKREYAERRASGEIVLVSIPRLLAFLKLDTYLAMAGTGITIQGLRTKILAVQAAEASKK